MEESESHPAGEVGLIAKKDDSAGNMPAENKQVLDDMEEKKDFNNGDHKIDFTNTEVKTHFIYNKFISTVANEILEDTAIFNEGSAAEVCQNLEMNDEITIKHMKAELEKLRLKIITLHRLSQLGIAPENFRLISEAMYSYDPIEILMLYQKAGEYAKALEIVKTAASDLALDMRIIARAQSILINNMGILQTVPSAIAATAISIAIITFHLKRTYCLVDIAKACHIAESAVYSNIQKIMESKRITKEDYPTFSEIESLMYSLKAFFTTNKKVPPVLLREYKKVQTRFRTQILECAQLGTMNSIRFNKNYPQLMEFFETNLVALIDSEFIAFEYDSNKDIATYTLTDKGREELELSRSFYKKLETFTKSRDDSAEEWAVWAGPNSDDSNNTDNSNELEDQLIHNEGDRGTDRIEGR